MNYIATHSHSPDCHSGVAVYPHVRLRARICRCYTTQISLPTVLQALIYDYIDISYSVCVSDELLTMPLYNIPVIVDANQGPDRTVVDLSQSSRSAIALNGYNHTRQGNVDIFQWLNDTLIARPPQLVVFQPMFGSLVHTDYDTRGYTFVSIPAPMEFVDYLIVHTPDKRLLFLSAFDALNKMDKHSQSECQRREPTTIPSPNKIDVLFVHRIDKSVRLDASTLQYARRYGYESPSLVFSQQVLQHVVTSSHVVYVGSICMSSYVDPVGSSSKTDFIRLIVLETSVKTNTVP